MKPVFALYTGLRRKLRKQPAQNATGHRWRRKTPCFRKAAAQKAAIEENVYTYFNTNKAILQSSFNEDEWNAYYEGELEPFAIQLSLVLTNMLFSPREQAFGNSVFYSANRLQYASNNTKLNVTTQLFDRGMMTQNQALDVWNIPGIGPRGDRYFILKEYAEQTEITPTGAAAPPMDAPAGTEPQQEGEET